MSAKDRSNSGFSVAAAGDVNGDGLADVLIGAKRVDGYTGRSYVVFGKDDGCAVDLSEIASGGHDDKGFAIFGQSAGDYSGTSVAERI